MDPLTKIRFEAACQAHDEFHSAFAHLFTEPYFDRTEVEVIAGKFRLETLIFLDSGRVGRIICVNDASGNLIYTGFPMVGEQIFKQYIQHSNQKEYYIIGTDLDSFILINLTEVKVDYVSFDRLVAEDKPEFSHIGWWYISDWMYNPANDLVAANGFCIQNMGMVELIDFSNPDNIFFPSINLSGEIYHKYDLDDDTLVRSWTADNGLELWAPGAPNNTLYMSEEELLDTLKKGR